MSLALLAVVLLSACGGGGPGPRAQGDRTTPCGPAERELKRPPTLPEGFPNPSQVTYTKAEKAGPSDIIEGYFNGELSTAFSVYRSAFEGSGYDVIKDEQEAQDAEVFFAGQGRSGQVRLDEECEGRANVTITIRPS